MIKLQELSTLIPDVLREWQDKETMESLGDQLWNEMNEEWAEFTLPPEKKAVVFFFLVRLIFFCSYSFWRRSNYFLSS